LDRIAAYRRLLVEGPVLEIPLGKHQMSFNPSELTPIDGVGVVYPTLTLLGAWGKLEVHKGALLAEDHLKAVVSAPVRIEESVLAGDGWELRLEAGWKAVAGARNGDWKLAKQH
jgi:hypothetical protein